MKKSGRPKAQDPINVQMNFKVKAREFHKLEYLAKTYANGNMSKWLRHASLTGERRFLNKKGPVT